MASVGVALSGGGHRATVWALGALLYLSEAGKSRDVTSVVSVSGGSIANGYVADKLDYAQTSPEALREAVKPLLSHIAKEGLFAFGRATNRYLAALIAVVLLASVGVLVWLGAVGVLLVDLAGGFARLGWTLPGWLDQPGWVAWYSAALVVAIIAAALVAARRSVVVDRAMARVHFSDAGRARVLNELDRTVAHVICATELQSGDHMYFSPRFVSSYRFGVGEPEDLLLSTAVQCSACLPGAFRPRRLPTARHGFRPFPNVAPSEAPSRMVLSDGGVTNNMADQWHQGFAARRRRWPELAELHAEAEELVVVNASAGWEWRPLDRWGLLRGEVAGLRRATSIMYDATTAHRRKGLVGRFDRAELSGEGLRGSLVHIPQSPWDIAERWARAGRSWPDRASRAQAVLELLRTGPQQPEDWAEIAAANAAVRTTLGALGEEVTVRLLRHAYVLAMCNLHIILGYPLLDLPADDELRDLVR